ncbi:DUF2399 domain-containing protein [Streptomyces clavifer]
MASRADFDSALVRAVLAAIPGAEVWRMTATGYTARLHPAPFEPDVLDLDRFEDTPWDPPLAAAMRVSGRPAYEEALIDELPADLRRGSPPQEYLPALHVSQAVAVRAFAAGPHGSV